jgi:ankyrin repeat protein
VTALEESPVMCAPEDAFLIAVLEGDAALVARLLETDGAFVHARTCDGLGRGLPARSTALHLAVRYGHDAIVDALIAAGAPLDARNAEGRTPLHDALVFGHEQRSRLIEAGAAIDACHAAFLDWVDRLREIVLADPATLDDKTTGVRPLGWACYGNAARSARVLLDLGARADAGELLCAAQVAGVRAGRLLLERGADPNGRHQGFSALHAAITTPFTSDLTPFVTLLLEYGADANQLTAGGQRPLDLVAFASAAPGSAARAEALAACDAVLRRHGAQPSSRD